jgi:YD repeat-containing protein
MTGTSRFIALVLMSLGSGILHAQAWVEYIDESERFIVNFPGEPEVLDTVYLTELGATMPARSYAVDNPPSHFSLIVVDYTEADRILEGTVPDEAPPPGLFQQSLGILDEDGRRIRYSYDENDNRVRIDTSYEWIAPGDPVTGEPDPENR